MKKYIMRGAILLGASSLISRLLGILRDYIFSDIFGATGAGGIWELDAYFAAFRLPDLLFNLLLYGTLSAAFVPIFSAYIKDKKDKEAWSFANNVLNILILILVAGSVLIFIFAPQIIGVIYPGFPAEKLSLIVDLTRIMLVSPLLFGLSSFAQSVQTSFNNFIFYSLAPVFYNLSIIVAALLFAKDHGVYAITYGVIIGAALHFLVQAPILFKLGFRYQAFLNTKMADIREMFKLVVPRIFGLAIMQFNLLFDNFIASFLFAGSLSILNYSINLSSLPLGVIGISFAIASFASLSQLAHSNETEEFRKTLMHNLRNILSLVIPASIGLIILRFEIIGLILSGEAFTVADQIWTASTLALFSVSLFAQSCVPILARSFYAYKNTKTPVYISLASFGLNIVLSLVLVFVMDWNILGLAAANSVAGILNFGLLYWMLSKKIGAMPSLGKSTIHFLIGSTIMAGGLIGMKELWQNNWGTLTGAMDNAIFLAVSIPAGVILYFAYLKVAKVKLSFRKILE